MNTDKTEQENQENQTEIFEYIRKRKGGMTHKIGVIYGTIDNNTIKIGWSKCNVKEGDDFNADIGIEMAKERAVASYITQGTDHPTVPLCIKRHIRQFGARCVRYFQDANKLELPL